MGFFEYDDGHGWSKPRREATYRWLERWLHDRVDDGVEPEIETELESDLYVTQTGQVSTSYPEAETVQSINRAEAERDYPKRTAARLENPGELRQLVSSRLMMRKDRSTPRVSHHGGVGRDGYRIEKIVLQTEKGIDVPALVLVPRDGRTQKPAVLYVNAAGKSVDSDIEALARAGHVVMAPDPRGIGESRPRSSAGGYNPLWQTFQRALLVGKTLAGMQVEDLLAAFDYLASREDVDPERVAVLGKGNGGVLGLFVAVLEPRVEKLAIEGTVLSYREIVSAKLHENLTGIIVPGVLEDFDLPDLAASLASRRLWIVDPRSATGSLLSIELAREEYGNAAEIRHRPEGWDLKKVYSGWLEAHLDESL